VTDKALEEIIFRAEHGVLQSLTPYPRAQRIALLPSVVRMLLILHRRNGGVETEQGAGPGGWRLRRGGDWRSLSRCAVHRTGS
jgi:hypothetical protein